MMHPMKRIIATNQQEPLSVRSRAKVVKIYDRGTPWALDSLFKGIYVVEHTVVTEIDGHVNIGSAVTPSHRTHRLGMTTLQVKAKQARTGTDYLIEPPSQK